MRVPTLVLIALAATCAPVEAQDLSKGFRQGPGGYYKQGNNSGPYSIADDGTVRLLGTPGQINVMSMPFQRLHLKSIRLDNLGTTPKRFDVRTLRPPEARSYRIAIPCDVNVRLMGTTDPNAVMANDDGVLYLAGTDVTMGTSRPDYIFAKTTAVPSTDCTPEMHYGFGGG